MTKLPKKITIPFYCDPGHGWIKVKKELLKLLNISDKITSYSYMRKEYAYLEEDCDQSLFYNTLKSNGCEVKYKEYYTNKESKIRSYESYHV